jgi:hypothetical protein
MAVEKANTVRHNAIQEIAELTASFLFVKTPKDSLLFTNKFIIRLYYVLLRYHVEHYV